MSIKKDALSFGWYFYCKGRKGAVTYIYISKSANIDIINVTHKRDRTHWYLF